MPKTLDDVVNSKKKAPKIVAGIFLSAALLFTGCKIPDYPARTYENWHYQLQNAQYSNLKSLNVEALVVDYEDSKLTQADIINIQSDNKDIFSYLCIGGAENYRSYWQPDWKQGNPSFIDEPVPGWPGDYYVKYWDPAWQQIIRDRVVQVANLGYNGVYLDMIDGYYHYQVKGRSTAANEMISFIHDLRDITTAINPNFLIVPQNAPELYDYPEFKSIIDGFGKEDTWFYDDQRRGSADRNFELEYLDKAVADGKFVLAIDYATTPNKIQYFYDKCLSHGFSATVSNRALNLDSPVQ
jgi:cysteinyl-tRNA synthetase, unknown class